MRTQKQIFLSIFLVAMAFALWGCSQPPKEEENAAKDAIQAARDAEAPIYARDVWSDADQAFATAESTMQAKEYDGAKQLFITVLEKAKAAKSSAETNKKALADELAKSKDGVQAGVAAVKASFAKARKKLAKDAAANIQSMISDAEQNVDRANQSILDGKLNDAKDQLAAASAKSDGATSALQTALTAKVKKHAVVKHKTTAPARHAKKPAVKHTTKKKKRR